MSLAGAVFTVEPVGGTRPGAILCDTGGDVMQHPPSAPRHEQRRETTASPLPTPHVRSTNHDHTGQSWETIRSGAPIMKMEYDALRAMEPPWQPIPFRTIRRTP
jgi:hypothetical protein